MKQLFVRLSLCAGLLSPFVSGATGTWKQVSADAAPAKLQVMHPKQFLVYTMDEGALKLQLWNVSANPDAGVVISLPLPDGTSREFKVWETPMMPADLAAQNPETKTFTAEAVDNRNVTAKLDFTLYGFHAMIFDGEQTSFVDPYDNYHDGFYMVHYKKDEVRSISERMVCQVHTHDDEGPAGAPMMMEQTKLPKLAYKVVNGYQLRTYRIAVSCSHQYAQAATGLSSPTIAQVFAKMTTTMNRINGVYEREVSVTMAFVSNETQIIWPTATGSTNGPDPFSAIDADANSCLTTNQAQCDTRIGATSYDIGHVFTTGGGGLSLLGVVCTPGAKAQSVTGSTSPTGDGYDIDFVAHEIGHEFDADHPFNNDDDGSCAGNRSSTDAYEPGSGSTIMAYAGICTPDDIQAHSDPYFHAVSLSEIQGYITNAGNCSVNTATGNKLVGYSAFAASFSIPYLTPFELKGPALIDSVADSATLYCWEEWDLGPASTFAATTSAGPIFRSFNPTTSPTRVFPKLSSVLTGVLSYQGEKVPTVARDLKFKCTFRNILHNKGCITLPDDIVTLHAVATPTAAGFKVTSQGTAGITYAGGSTTTVTWDVVGTNTSPVNATTVDIYMTVNGTNFPYFVGNFPNNGSASITVPNPAATSANCRFKVKGAGNVFFNVNSKNFTVTTNTTIPISPNGVQAVNTLANTIKVFPVPATNVLHITAANELNAVIINAVGQKVWEGKVSTQADVPVASWAKGMYYVRFVDATGGNTAVKSVVIE